MITVIKLGAPWCGPCRLMEPTIKRLQEKYNIPGSDVSIQDVNVDEDVDISIKYGVKGIPTTIFLKDDTVEFKEVGALTESKIEDFITKLKS